MLQFSILKVQVNLFYIMQNLTIIQTLHVIYSFCHLHSKILYLIFLIYVANVVALLIFSLKGNIGAILLPSTIFFCRPEWDHMKVNAKYFQRIIFISNSFVPLSFHYSAARSFFYIQCNTKFVGKNNSVLLRVASVCRGGIPTPQIVQSSCFLPFIHLNQTKQCVFQQVKGYFPLMLVSVLSLRLQAAAMY